MIPLVETERLMKIALAGDLIFAQTDYAIVHAIDAESGRLLWSAQLGERTGFARGVTANSFAVYLTNANYFPRARQENRQADLEAQPGDDSDQHAGLRRRSGHGRD